MRCCIILAIIFVLSACQGDKLPKNVLPPEKMQLVMWDFFQADVYTTDISVSDSGKSLPKENVKLQNAIFRRYKITRQQFYKSYDYYMANPGLMIATLDSMMLKKSRTKADADTVRMRKMKIFRDSARSID